MNKDLMRKHLRNLAGNLPCYIERYVTSESTYVENKHVENVQDFGKEVRLTMQLSLASDTNVLGDNLWDVDVEYAEGYNKVVVKVVPQSTNNYDRLIKEFSNWVYDDYFPLVLARIEVWIRQILAGEAVDCSPDERGI